MSVWRPIEFNPAYVEMAEALERHVGDEAGGDDAVAVPRVGNLRALRSRR